MDTDLYKMFKKLLKKEYKKFFKIFIVEVFNQIGYDKIFQLYNKTHHSKKTKTANIINNILNRTNCNQRILVATNQKHIVLEELNISFTNDYIKKEDLKHFYHLVKQYIIYNPEKLIAFEKTIPNKNFFFNWLKFLIRNFIIERNINSSHYGSYENIENEIVTNFEFLASDVEPYKGKPRAIDITYENSALLDLSIEQGLKYIRTKSSWGKVIKYLNKVPYNTLAIIEKKYLNDENIKYIIDTYEEFDKSDELDYSEHLDYAFHKAIYYAKIGKKKIAKTELKKATFLLTSYTHRKDRTLEEIIEPLSSINNINHKFAKKYAKKLKYLTDAVMKHTEDGKDIRWLTIEWFEEFLKVDSKLASKYLLNQLLNYPNFWKLDYMFVDYIQYISNQVDPIILNFLYKLSPTNSKNDYINSFADTIHKIIKIDEKLAKQSLINIFSRDLNNSSDTLKSNTGKKLEVLKNILDIDSSIKSKEKKDNSLSYSRDSLKENINKQFGIDSYPLVSTTEVLIKYFEKKDDLLDKDLNKIYFYLQENNNSNTIIQDVLISLIQKRFPRGEHYFENIRQLINSLNIQNDTKIFLLVNTFLYSKDGWFRQFTNKEALKDAIEIDNNEALNTLAQSLLKIFSNFGYGTKSTANLIIAFEYAGINKKDVLSMYKMGFEQIEYRLPDNNDFDWKEVKDKDLKNMNNNEFAIAMILSKMTNLDSLIQKEIIFSINYIFNYDKNLLIKPIKWFFNNLNYFPHISIASLLELFLLQFDDEPSFFQNFKKEIIDLEEFENLYINNNLENLLIRIEHV